MFWIFVRIATVSETVKAIKLLSSGKAPGSDAIPAEIYKAGDHPVAEKLTELFHIMWRKEAIPQEFNNYQPIQKDRESSKKVREKSRECHNHKPQPFPDTKRKRKPTILNKHKTNKRTKSTKISSLFPKRGNRNTKRNEKHKNKMTHGKTYNKSPRRINHKATKSKTNTGTTALERSVEQTTGGFKALLQLANKSVTIIEASLYCQLLGRALLGSY